MFFDPNSELIRLASGSILGNRMGLILRKQAYEDAHATRRSDDLPFVRHSVKPLLRPSVSSLALPTNLWQGRTMNITLAHTKGGVTKSSIATNLAVWLFDQGHSVAAIDLDAGRFGNQTLTTVLSQAEPQIPVHQPEGPDALSRLLADLGESFDFVVADAPGGFQQTAETNLRLLRHTDYVLVPVKPDFDDIEPLSVVAEVVAESRRNNPLLQARVLLNCLDGRTLAAKDLAGTWATIQAVAPTLGVLKQAVRINRHAFQSARLTGSVVVRLPRSAACHDLHDLFTELLGAVIATTEQRSLQEESHTLVLTGDAA